MFDPTKPYQRRDGKFAKIIYTRTDGTLIVLDADEGVFFVNKDGNYYFGKEYDYDLVNVPKKIEGWLNLYPHSSLSDSKESADINAANGRVACIFVSFTEGEGL